MATHVLQFYCLGDSGFRFPIARFPSGGCTASTLYFIFWEGDAWNWIYENILITVLFHYQIICMMCDISENLIMVCNHWSLVSREEVNGGAKFHWATNHFPKKACCWIPVEQRVNWCLVYISLITRVYYCILDGAEVNRQFIKLHFADVTEAIKDKFMTPNIYNGNCPLIFIMDHKIKLSHPFKIL